MRVFLGIFPVRCENPAGLHGIRDNPVISWNFENPVPVGTDLDLRMNVRDSDPVPVFFFRYHPVQTSPVIF